MFSIWCFLIACSFLLLPFSYIPLVLPDAVEDDGGKGDDGQYDQHRPDRAEETGRQTDEESGERQQCGGFQNPAEQASVFQPSHPLLWFLPGFRRGSFSAFLYLVAVARPRVAGDDDIAVDLVAPCIPAGLTAAGKELQIWTV